MSIAFVFPGQGSQAVGMGMDLADAFAVARETLEEVDDAIGQNLTRLIRQGPDEDLMLTENAQPALMAVSIAALRVLENEAGLVPQDRLAMVAGHSLGEYTALAAAGALELADTARLLKTRGRAMQEAVPVGAGAMAALLGADLAQAHAIAEEAAEDGICDTANDNAPGQIVLSGDTAAIDRAIDLAKEKGVKRSIKLPVSAPFHCQMMKPAADVMQDALADVVLTPPEPVLIANVSAEPASDPDEIRELLVTQVTAMVRWRESVLAMRDAGVSTIVEIGAGRILSGLVKRIDPDLAAKSVGTPAEVDELVNIL